MLTELLKQIAAMIAEALAAEGEATPDAETAADAMMAMEEEALSVVGDEEDEAKIKAILDENFQRLADAYLKAAHEAQQQKQQKAREAVKSFRANTPAPAKSDRVGALSRQAPALKRASAGYGNDGRDDFLYYIRTGDIRGVDPSLRANVNPLESVTNAQGAVTVPDDFLPEIIAKRDELSIPRLAGARVIQTSLDVVNVPIEDTSNTYFVITAQEGAADEDEPAFDQKAITVYRFTKLMKLSVEIVADNKANLEGFLTESAGRAWALTENKYTLTGTGSSQPQGIFVGGTAGLTFDSATAIAAAEIPELLYKINPAYMTGGAWTASGATIGNIRGLGTSTNRWYAPTPYGVPAAYNGALGDIEGYPAFASAEVSAIGAGNKSLAFGNWAFYGLVERQELTVQRLVELYAGNGQIGLLWSVRMGGSVLQSEAFQYGTHPTA